MSTTDLSRFDRIGFGLILTSTFILYLANLFSDLFPRVIRSTSLLYSFTVLIGASVLLIWEVFWLFTIDLDDVCHKLVTLTDDHCPEFRARSELRGSPILLLTDTLPIFAIILFGCMATWSNYVLFRQTYQHGT